jgi:formyl-CoA transferase
LIQKCDVLVENFASGILDRMEFTWERIHEINPRIILASVKGFGTGPFEDCKAYENIAQCMGGAASTTGFADNIPSVTGAGMATLAPVSISRWAFLPRWRGRGSR